MAAACLAPFLLVGAWGLRTSPPPPPIAAPQSLATAPLRSELAIRQRIADMSPALRFQVAGPALPGSLRLAALSYPSAAPDIRASAPRIVPEAPPLVPPRSAFALPTDPPLVKTEPQVAILPAPPSDFEPRGDAEAPQCRPDTAVEQTVSTPPPVDRDAFGQALAAAAFDQVSRFVVYDARYTRIAYPGGDVASLHGVCTDVVIRAYRALGIDLQQIVHESRLGAGDNSIDHRRTETLRRFFAERGELLAASAFAEDYAPGDIVTYHRPQNRISTAHIAIVSDRIGPSGRPMIIHNRGLGVQLEDALFVDRITGHYRYLGPATPLAPVPMAARRTLPVARGRVPADPGEATASAASRAAVLRAAAKSPAAHKLALRYGTAQPTQNSAFQGTTARTPAGRVP